MKTWGVGSPVGGVAYTTCCDHALVVAVFVIVTTPRTLPSDGVLRRHHQRYYDPLGLPLHHSRLAIGLVASCASDLRPCRRISRVPCFSVDACCSPYPAGILDNHFGSSRRGCCLRRDVSGSASRLFLCRGCKLHFMLRPASLPPIAGLSTSRFGLQDLSWLRRPATRRSDAYRDGTLTRRKSAARPLRV